MANERENFSANVEKPRNRSATLSSPIATLARDARPHANRNARAQPYAHGL